MAPRACKLPRRREGRSACTPHTAHPRVQNRKPLPAQMNETKIDPLRHYRRRPLRAGRAQHRRSARHRFRRRWRNKPDPAAAGSADWQPSPAAASLHSRRRMPPRGCRTRTAFPPSAAWRESSRVPRRQKLRGAVQSRSWLRSFRNLENRPAKAPSASTLLPPFRRPVFRAGEGGHLPLPPPSPCALTRPSSGWAQPASAEPVGA